MGFTATINGSLGHTTSSYARKVIAMLAVASSELKEEFYKKLNFRVSASAAVAAANTLISAASGAVAPSDAEFVRIGSTTYTFKTVLTGAANEVLIGSTANARDALYNLKAAVNCAADVGVLFGTGTTANADITATDLTTSRLLLVAKAAGVAGNTLVATKTSTTLSFSHASTFTGGVAGDPSDTNLPVTVTLGLDTPVKFIAIRTVNSATIVLHSQEGSGPTDIYQKILLGASDHPEGFYVVFGSWNLIGLQVTEVGSDNTEVEIWAGS
jgi:hypothetical protein